MLGGLEVGVLNMVVRKGLTEKVTFYQLLKISGGRQKNSRSKSPDWDSAWHM